MDQKWVHTHTKKDVGGGLIMVNICLHPFWYGVCTHNRSITYILFGIGYGQHTLMAIRYETAII